MAPRIAIAGFLHETNTFAPMPTVFENFVVEGDSYAGFRRGPEILDVRGKRINSVVAGFLDVADPLGYEIVPLTWACAEPAGQVTANAFEKIMGLIAAGLSDQGPFDGVFLDLHGAMVFEGFHDGETEILRRVRAIVGDIPIVAALDLHGNIALPSVEYASVLIGYRTYPHIDLFETGQRAAQAISYLVSGKPLHKAFRQLPFLVPISAQSTNTEPCRSLYALIDEVEQDPRVISATIMAGFPPADIEDCGPSIFAYASTQQAADSAAHRLYEAYVRHEPDFKFGLLDPDAAVEKAIRLAEGSTKPILLADVQDNSGGGATSDTPWILEALVRHDAREAALALMFDPEAAAAAHAAGEGVEITLDLGGKLTPGQKPFHGTFRVEKLFNGPFVPTGPMVGGKTTSLGKMVQLKIGGVRVVVASRRTQANDQSYFRQVGIEPAKMKILVVKSANHYRADFEPISAAIIPVEAPGAIVEDPSKAVYRHLREGIRLKPLGPEFHRGR